MKFLIASRMKYEVIILSSLPREKSSTDLRTVQACLGVNGLLADFSRCTAGDSENPARGLPLGRSFSLEGLLPPVGVRAVDSLSLELFSANGMPTSVRSWQRDGYS